MECNTVPATMSGIKLAIVAAPRVVEAHTTAMVVAQVEVSTTILHSGGGTNRKIGGRKIYLPERKYLTKSSAR